MRLLKKVTCAIEPLEEEQLLVVKGGDGTLPIETIKDTESCRVIYNGCTVNNFNGNCTWGCGANTSLYCK